MLLSDLLRDVEIIKPYEDAEIRFITDNSRNVTVGCAFVCISGTHNDGHLFAPQALQKGARVVITQRDLKLENQIIVADTKKAYAFMCAAFFGYPSKKLRLFAVTGTNGKTSTAFLLQKIIEQNGESCGLIGTVEGDLGGSVVSAQYTTPDAFQLQCLFRKMVERGCSCCVMEASSQALEQGRLDACEFEVAVFTNITQDHLDYHKTFENYLNAKKRLFYKSATALINLDDSNSSIMAESLTCKVVRYSARTNDADFSAENIFLSPDSVEYDLNYNSQKYGVKVNIPGVFSVYNSLAAVACSALAGFDIHNALLAVRELKGVAGRAEVVKTDTPYTVVIDYAHSPDSMKNILETVNGYCKGRIITVFGCGGDRDKTKRPLMGDIAARLSDIVVVTSDNPRGENPSLIIKDILKGINKNVRAETTVVENRRDAICKALETAKKDDVVLLLGKGHETYQIINGQKNHFDEREVITEFLKAHNN